MQQIICYSNLHINFFCSLPVPKRLVVYLEPIILINWCLEGRFQDTDHISYLQFLFYEIVTADLLANVCGNTVTYLLRNQYSLLDFQYAQTSLKTE